jgi:hypothetical protein
LGRRRKRLGLSDVDVGGLLHEAVRFG